LPLACANGYLGSAKPRVPNGRRGVSMTDHSLPSLPIETSRFY